MTGGAKAADTQRLQCQAALAGTRGFRHPGSSLQRSLPAPSADLSHKPERPEHSRSTLCKPLCRRSAAPLLCSIRFDLPGGAQFGPRMKTATPTASPVSMPPTTTFDSGSNIDKAVVTDCWMSSVVGSPAWPTDRACDPMLDGGFGMAVIVQKMIQAERSGVCFTRRPNRQPIPEEARSSNPVGGWERPWWMAGFHLTASGWQRRIGMQEQKISRKRLKVSEGLKDPERAAPGTCASESSDLGRP